MRIMTTIETIWYIEVLLARSNWTSQISYEYAASLVLMLSVYAATMYFYSIATKNNGPLEAAHAHNDDDRDDMVH